MATPRTPTPSRRSSPTPLPSRRTRPSRRHGGCRRSASASPPPSPSSLPPATFKRRSPRPAAALTAKPPPTAHAPPPQGRQPATLPAPMWHRRRQRARSAQNARRSPSSSGASLLREQCAAPCLGCQSLDTAVARRLGRSRPRTPPSTSLARSPAPRAPATWPPPPQRLRRSRPRPARRTRPPPKPRAARRRRRRPPARARKRARPQGLPRRPGRGAQSAVAPVPSASPTVRTRGSSGTIVWTVRSDRCTPRATRRAAATVRAAHSAPPAAPVWCSGAGGGGAALRRRAVGASRARGRARADVGLLPAALAPPPAEGGHSELRSPKQAALAHRGASGVCSRRRAREVTAHPQTPARSNGPIAVAIAVVVEEEEVPWQPKGGGSEGREGREAIGGGGGGGGGEQPLGVVIGRRPQIGVARRRAQWRGVGRGRQDARRWPVRPNGP
eukprot:SAG11_NODE_310_length_10927_cov_19.887514_3_plen_444_part_00